MSLQKDVVNEYLEGFRTSDHARVLACLTDDVEWSVHGHYHVVGKEAYDANIEDDAFVGSPVITMTDLVEEGDVVMGCGTVEVQRADGTTMRASLGELWGFRDGRIARRESWVVPVSG